MQKIPKKRGGGVTEKYFKDYYMRSQKKKGYSKAPCSLLI